MELPCGTERNCSGRIEFIVLIAKIPLIVTVDSWKECAGMQINILHVYCTTELCTTSFFCIVLALYGVLCWFYCLNNTHNRNGHCDHMWHRTFWSGSACVFCGILHACCNILHACTAMSCIHVPWHACITISYTLSCCIVHRFVCYGILFASTSHVLQHPAWMYCSILYRCTAHSFS